MKKFIVMIMVMFTVITGLGLGNEAFGMDFETELGQLPGTVVAKTVQTIYSNTYTDEYASVKWRPVYFDIRWYGYRVDEPIYTFEGAVYDLEMNGYLSSFYVLTPDQVTKLLLGCIKDY